MFVIVNILRTSLCLLSRYKMQKNSRKTLCSAGIFYVIRFEIKPWGQPQQEPYLLRCLCT